MICLAPVVVTISPGTYPSTSAGLTFRFYISCLRHIRFPLALCWRLRAGISSERLAAPRFSKILRTAFRLVDLQANRFVGSYVFVRTVLYDTRM